MANLEQLGAAVRNFAEAVDHLYGHYLDSTHGFRKNAEWLDEAQRRTRATRPGINLDAATFTYGIGAPGGGRPLHHTTQGAFRERNADGGANHVYAGQLLVVLLYTYWETRHRAAIAAALELADQHELKVPIMGDLRRLRIDVVHHRGILQAENVTRLSVVRDS